MNAQEQLPRKSRTKKPKRSVSSTSTRDRTNTKRNKRRNRQREREKNRRVVRAPCFAIGRKGEGGKAAPPPRHPPRDLLASGGQKRIGRAYFIDTPPPRERASVSEPRVDARLFIHSRARRGGAQRRGRRRAPRVKHEHARLRDFGARCGALVLAARTRKTATTQIEASRARHFNTTERFR